MKRLNKNNGITLIALVITIIVMLILVGVSITIAVNGGLFNYAGKAAKDTQNAINGEQELSNGRIKVDGVWYDTIDDYLNNKPSENQREGTVTTPDDDEPGEPVEGNNGETFSAPYTTTVKDNYKDEEGNKATIPTGFSVGTSEGINKISTGLVIRDANGNEFVWIPIVEDLVNPYNYSSGSLIYSEPKVLESIYRYSNAAYDSQDTLNYLYGENYYNYDNDFNYAEEYEEIIAQVNKYGGFYIGRYETTIGENGNIGSKYNTEVLTAGTTLFTKDETNYPYRWHGLYYAQKNANVTGNGTKVQTAMIYGQLWDITMDFIRYQRIARKTNYDVDTSTSTWHTGSGVVNSGQANPTTETSSGDVALNIWDLESNAKEWTQELAHTATSTSGSRISRGGYFNGRGQVDQSTSVRFTTELDCFYTEYSSRLALYIK